MAITTRPQIYNVSHNIITEELVPTSNKLSSIVHIEVPPNKAIVGKNAFAHEAGIHQDGILKNSLTYEIMTPRSVGAGQNKLVLGKHSGRHAVLDRARKLGFQLTREQLEKVYEETIALADLKKEVNDEDLKLILIKGNLKTETVNAIT
jgi:2-isopropylmalate synthase